MSIQKSDDLTRVSILQEHPQLAPYRVRYHDLPMQPLAVTLHLKPGSHVASYGRRNLDNLLAWCVVQEATNGDSINDPTLPFAGWNLPVPLQALWHSQQGLPLYAASSFWEMSANIEDECYWVKRPPTGKRVKAKSGKHSVISIKGPWMARQIPMPTTVCDVWQARGIGNIEEVARLLRLVDFTGKRRAAGFGEVDRWEVAPADITPTAAGVLIWDGETSRPIPIEALSLFGKMPVGGVMRMGWTPPQWNSRLWSACWPPGCRIDRDIDYFEEAGRL